MANIKSAKKAIRGSAKKREHNLFWKRRMSSASKSLLKVLNEDIKDTAILNERLSVLQKVVDKAAKEKVIHKNKAARIKAGFSKKIAAHANIKTKKTKKSTAKPTNKQGKAKSKSS